ncbi:MAG TPA: isoprenylcysteine carboxylmethyltransferase family protein [Crenotrichaceae bacterium]|nr:isoprenylcysteine carboxylmethyltransferase family protein [Crenotrichaceae bacterium]
MLYRALLAFLALPGIFAGILPAYISTHDSYRMTGSISGIVLMFFGTVILLWCVRDFLVSGRGTLAPWDPPKNLVIVGLYRYSRNPMYVGIIIMLGGWVIYAGSPLLAIYTAFMATAFYVRVVFGEERILAHQFGDEWFDYTKSVARWLPGIG